MNLGLKRCSKPSTARKNPCTTTVKDKLYADRERTGDIKFVIDGEEIRAHRCILAALSPKFEAQFYGAMAEKDSVTVEDVSPGAFNEFLQFFYADEVTLTLENIEDVLNLAKQSLVDELVVECINYLIDLVGLDKIVWCYRLALDYDIKRLEKHCLKHIITNIKAVFQSADFRSCDHDMMCYILSLSKMNCKQTDAFDACISWARAKCERKGIDASDTTNLRLVLDGALSKIRFESLKIDEFAAIDKNFSGLLLAEESNKIFHAIISKQASHLECSFSKGQRARIDSKISQKNRNIEFQCDRTIELIGVVLCSRIDQDFTIFVDVTKIHKYGITFSKNESTIIFDEPIRVASNMWCDIFIQSKSFEQPFNFGLYGCYTEKNIEQHGIAFQFKNFNCENLNLITRLLFNTIEKS